MKKQILMGLMAAAGILLLSGCVPGASEIQATETLFAETQGAAEGAPVPSGEPGEQAAEPTLTSIPDAAQGSNQEAKPTARAGLQATDPETVSLGSGDIQLVEFFAFW